jgi:hypothetical protein
VVADAVTVELVYSKPFPGNREKYRENIKPSGLRSAANSLKPVNTRLSRQIPCTKEQGKLMDKQGLDSAFQGRSLAGDDAIRALRSADERRAVHRTVSRASRRCKGTHGFRAQNSFATLNRHRQNGGNN